MTAATRSLTSAGSGNLYGVDSVCPGCGEVVSAKFGPLPSLSRFELVAEANAAAAAMKRAGTIEWRKLPDGRYLGVETTVVVQEQVTHECRFRGGEGGAGDRAPLPSGPPPQETSFERDPAG